MIRVKAGRVLDESGDYSLPLAAAKYILSLFGSCQPRVGTVVAKELRHRTTRKWAVTQGGIQVGCTWIPAEQARELQRRIRSRFVGRLPAGVTDLDNYE